MSDYKLVSVESRKGGVGKTTAALNLGYLLKEKYHVLLLDIDITGTSIQAIQESRFWMDDTFLVKDEKGAPINLLRYYTNTYLKGDKLFSFSSNDEDDKVIVKEGYINVIASELYADDATLLYNPSLLLDNIHVYWLTKLITSICDGFSNCFDDEKQSVVILDNSPGFVGIGKAVHDILTDIGPEDAKFLTVSSLDIQDLESSLKSVYALHQEYLDKFNGARFLETQKGDEDFYAQMRLSGDTEYSYYRLKRDEAEMSSYQGLIINKVAKGIIEGRNKYNFTRTLNPELDLVYQGLLGDNVKDFLVPFDNVLSTQFYGMFEEKSKVQINNVSILKKRLATIDGQLRMLDEVPAYALPYDILRRANGLDKTIDTLKGALIACGFETLASKFNPDWSPISPIRKMIDILKDIGFTSESFELYIPNRERTQKEMDSFKGLANKATQYAEQNQEYVWLASSVAAVACELSFCYSNKMMWNDNRMWRTDMPWGEGKETWTTLINNCLWEWQQGILEMYRGNIDKETYLAAFIISDEAKQYDAILKELFNNEDFVMTIKQAFCRLTDILPDMRTLVNLIRAITVNNEGSYSPDVDFAPFLNHKIVEKTYDYNQAKDKMYEELRDADYMASYREVLGRVISRWNL